MSMKCKSCKREIEDNSIFCNWCGKKQLKEKKSDGAIKIPKAKQLPSGSWHIYLTAEKQPITEPTKDLCEAKAMAFRAGFIERKKGAKEAPILLDDAIEKYISRRAVLSPNTIRSYRIYQKNRFQSCQGVNIRDAVDWQRYINEEAKLCAPKTLKNAWGFIKSVLEENGIPAPKVTLPQSSVKEHKWLTPEQIVVFCKAVEGKGFEKEALFALHGLRRGELLALRWGDVDIKSDTIRIHATIAQNEKNQYVEKPTTKTEKSTRTVPIMIPRLRQLLKEEMGAPNERISHEPPNGLWRKINDVCAESGLPLVGVHGLRHSFASLAYHLGFKEEECMRIGGWSDYRIMHEIYTHIASTDINARTKTMESFYKDSIVSDPRPENKKSDSSLINQANGHIVGVNDCINKHISI